MVELSTLTRFVTIRITADDPAEAVKLLDATAEAVKEMADARDEAKRERLELTP